MKTTRPAPISDSRGIWLFRFCVPLLLTLAAHGESAMGLASSPFATAAAPQTERPVLTPADYGQWESMGFRAAPLSPDGRWLAVSIQRVDGTHELRTFFVPEPGEPIVAAEGTAPVFGGDSAWLAYRIGHSEAEIARLRKKEEPLRDGVGLLELATRRTETVEQVERFAFGAGGAVLAMLRYPTESKGEEEKRRAADLVVRDLGSGAEINFGNVAEFAWQPEGSLLAMAIEAQGRIGNGVQLYDAASGTLRVTDGAESQVRHRLLDLDPDQEALDPSALYMSLYGEWTKRYGFARARLGDANPIARNADLGAEHLVWLDNNVGRLSKAEDAPVYSYIVQGFDNSPDIFVGGAELGEATQITHTNAFQQQYGWGRSELIDYESAWGRRLQGALFYPANYDPDKKYPMIVYVYERLSQTVHDYVLPSRRNAYDTTVFNAEGYFVLRPDIVFRNRRPGTSALECVVPAVQAALATGMIDPERVGMVGHSWGGYETAFVPTQTDIFAAAIAGAPLTNFFSMFGTIHWSAGLPETSHFETGQARMEVPYWVDMEAYARESPVIHIQQLETPMLVFFGDKDGTVDWHQGVELYNYARRAGKELVMLVYPGEGHGARQKKNQLDYHQSVLQWFGYYLQGKEAPKWITEGATVLERDHELSNARR